MDTGVLGMLVHPAETGEPRECKTWLKQLVLRGASVCVPEIADYELRRELLRMKSTESIKRLDELNTRLRYVPITREAMLKAAEFWAAARSAGRPTADDKALDGDAILAAQSVLLSQAGDEVVVATTNVGHLSQFVNAQSWQDVP
ncbi:MAG TPA: PIN domain-containing protein [Vicinamibacterales bacterium]|nr:PIN domain-containing protein [Vicinamibacterales bacterium]